MRSIGRCYTCLRWVISIGHVAKVPTYLPGNEFSISPMDVCLALVLDWKKKPLH